MFPCALKRQRKNMGNITACTNNFSIMSAWLIYDMGFPHNGQFRKVFSTAALTPVQTCISIKKPPNTTLILLTICLHSLWGPVIVCSLSLTVSVFFACKENIYCALFKWPHGTSKWYIPLFLSWEIKIFFSLPSSLSESRRIRFFPQRKAALVAWDGSRQTKKPHVALFLTQLT